MRRTIASFATCASILLSLHAYACAAETIINVGGWLYKTLDNANSDSEDISCQKDYLSIPSEWQLATSADDYAHLAVLSRPWGTKSIVLGKDSYATRQFKSVAAEDALLSVNGQIGVQNCDCCRVLIKKEATALDAKHYPDVTTPSIDHWMRFNSYRYATIDNSPMTSNGDHRLGCTMSAVTLPDEWEIVPELDEETELALMGPQVHFGTRCLVTADGYSYLTDTMGACNVLGDALVKVTVDTKKYYTVKQCPQRILIRAPLVQDDYRPDRFVPEEPLFRTIFAWGHVWATMDNAPVGASNSDAGFSAHNKCQLDPKRLRTEEGWSIATAAQLTYLMKTSELPPTFQTTCLVTSDGTSYSHNLQLCGEDQLISVGDFYSPKSCNQRILILKPLTKVAQLTREEIDDGKHVDWHERRGCTIWGYSHTTTFDDLHYTGFVRGEFFAVIGSMKNFLEVAVRFDNPPNSMKQTYVSAVAVKFGDNQFSFYGKDGNIEVRVDHEVVTDLKPQYDGVNATKVDSTTDSYRLSKEGVVDIEVTGVERASGTYLVVGINLARQYAGETKGLCGNMDGDQATDLTPNHETGAKDATKAYEVEYFINSFRLSKRDNLFDYEDTDIDYFKEDDDNYLHMDYSLPSLEAVGKAIDVICETYPGVYAHSCKIGAYRQGDVGLTDIFKLGYAQAHSTQPNYAWCHMTGFGHFHQFSGRRFTHQAVESFVMSKSMIDTLQIDVRMLKSEDWANPEVTFASQVRITDSLHGEYTFGRNEPYFYGFEHDFADGPYKRRDATVSRLHNDDVLQLYLFTYHDRLQVYIAIVETDGRKTLDVSIGINAALYHGQLEGICGTMDDYDAESEPSSFPPVKNILTNGEQRNKFVDGDFRSVATSALRKSANSWMKKQCERISPWKASGSQSDYEWCLADLVATHDTEETRVRIAKSVRETAEYGMVVTSSCVAADVTNGTIEWMGRKYATLDGVHPESGEYGCQTVPRKIPDGWKLAANDGATRSLIQRYGFATSCVVLGDGTSWATSSVGGSCGSQQLLSSPRQGCHYVKTCDSRVLIERIDSVELPAIANGDFSSGSSFSVPTSWRKPEVSEILEIEGVSSDTSLEVDAFQVSSNGGKEGNGVYASVETADANKVVALVSDSVEMTDGGFEVCAWTKNKDVQVLEDSSSIFNMHSLQYSLVVKGTSASGVSAFSHSSFTITPSGEESSFLKHCTEFYPSFHFIDAPSSGHTVEIFLIFGPGLAGEVWIDEVTVSVASGNILGNPDFEDGAGDKILYDHDQGKWISNTNSANYWRGLVSGFAVVHEDDHENVHCKSGKSCLVMGTRDELAHHGAYQTVVVDWMHNADSSYGQHVHARAWSEAVAVGGQRDENYAIVLDITFTDETFLRGQYAPFNTGSHTWEEASLSVSVEKPIKSVQMFLLFRNRKGVAFFDGAELMISAGPTIVSNYRFTSSVYGGVFGDPHIKTHNGEVYDLQAVGTFTLSKIEDFTVEGTFEEFPGPLEGLSGSFLRRVALQYAKDDHHTLRLTMETSDEGKQHMMVTENGIPVVSGDFPVRISSGRGSHMGMMKTEGNTNKGDYMMISVRLITGHGVDVYVRRTDSLQYLQCNVVLPTGTDLALTEGLMKELPIAASGKTSAEVFENFGVLQVAPHPTLFDPSASEFVVGVAENTASHLHTISGDGAVLEMSNNQNSACLSQSLDDPLHDSCLVDVYLTGDTDVAHSYHVIQSTLKLRSSRVHDITPIKRWEEQVGIFEEDETLSIQEIFNTDAAPPTIDYGDSDSLAPWALGVIVISGVVVLTGAGGWLYRQVIGGKALYKHGSRADLGMELQDTNMDDEESIPISPSGKKTVSEIMKSSSYDQL